MLAAGNPWDLSHYRQPSARLSTDSDLYSVQLPFKFTLPLLYNISRADTEPDTA